VPGFGAVASHVRFTASEKEAMSWINTGGQSWLDDRRRKRNT
jgi:hypothetical protein